MTDRTIPQIVAVVAAALITASCSSGSSSGVPTQATAISPVTASIRQAAVATPTGFTGRLCSVAVVQPASSFFIGSPSFEIVINAAQPVDFSALTLQMIDGSHLGGPTVTIPQSALTTQFGSTLILGGSTRAFTVQPRFDCAASRPTTVVGQLSVVDSGGRVHTTSVSAPFSLP